MPVFATVVAGRCQNASRHRRRDGFERSDAMCIVLVLHQTRAGTTPDQNLWAAVFLVVSSGLLVKLSLIGFGKIQQLLGLQF